MSVLIAGASGFLGKQLQKAFPDALCVSRKKRKGYITYDELPKSVDMIIHVAGKSLFRFPTKKHFEQMADSRANVLQKLSHVRAKHIICFSGIDVLPAGNITDETKPSDDSILSQIENKQFAVNPAISLCRIGIIQANDSMLSKIPFAFVPNASTYYTDVKDILSYLKRGKFKKTKNIVTKKVSYKTLFTMNKVRTIVIPKWLIPQYLKPFIWDRNIR